MPSNCRADFRTYLGKFKSRTRNRFRRGLRKLRELGGGGLELVRVERPDQVEEFLEQATEIAKKSWQNRLIGFPPESRADRRTLLNELASAGILRAYLLKCGTKPCAFNLTFISNSICYYYETAYLPELSEYSPGTMLEYLKIEDLIAVDPPRLIYYGGGDVEYEPPCSQPILAGRTTSSSCGEAG